MDWRLPFLILCLVACGGSPEASSGQTEEPAATPIHKSANDQEAKLARLRAAQNSACDKMCPEVIGCAMESLRQKVSEEKRRELDRELPLEERMRLKTEECLKGCKEPDLSPRQVRVVQGCLEAGGECAQFIDCLQAAQKES